MLENIFIKKQSSVQYEDRIMFFLRRQVSQSRRQRGVSAQETFKFVSDICAVTASFLPPSERCQDPRRLRVVRTYLHGGEGRLIFLRQEGCHGLQEDHRGNQSSHGKSTKLVKKPKKLFIYTLF